MKCHDYDFITNISPRLLEELAGTFCTVTVSSKQFRHDINGQIIFLKSDSIDMFTGTKQWLWLDEYVEIEAETMVFIQITGEVELDFKSLPKPWYGLTLSGYIEKSEELVVV